MQQPLVVAAHLLASKMDFQFTFHLGQVLAKCSMEHEAVANWLNTETSRDPQNISIILNKIQQLNSQQESQFIGKEYSLWVNADEVMVRANHLDIENQEVAEDNLHYYDAESIALCGKEDFVHFLQSYLNFMQYKN